MNKYPTYASAHDRMASTGEDQLTIRNPAGDKLGWFWLIYNNGSSPMELIADHTANDFCEGVWNNLEAKMERVAA